MRGALIGGGLAVFSAIGNTSKNRADMWTFSSKKRPICKGFQPRFLRGKYDYMSCTDIAKYFPHFQSAGEQFLLFPGISTLGHFVPKLRNGASAPGRRQPGLGRLPNKHFGKYFSAARRKNLECVHTRIACQKRKCGYTCPACR